MISQLSSFLDKSLLEPEVTNAPQHFKVIMNIPSAFINFVESLNCKF